MGREKDGVLIEGCEELDQPHEREAIQNCFERWFMAASRRHTTRREVDSESIAINPVILVLSTPIDENRAELFTQIRPKLGLATHLSPRSSGTLSRSSSISR